MTSQPDCPQNIYDNPDFFAGYAKLRENPLSANAILVDPTRDALLPSLGGRRVVDLGCGTGSFCRKAIEAGAEKVQGVDISERMLDVARHEPVNPETQPRLRYTRCSLDQWSAPAGTVDVVVSILALHYLQEIDTVFQNVADALTPGGVFVYCVEHPLINARREKTGWIKDASGRKQYWPVDDYADESERTTDWLVSGVRIYHRTIATYLNGIMDAGLVLSRIVEPTASDALPEARLAFADEMRRPNFLFVRATKP